MKDLKFEQKRSLSREEAADQLAALADALRRGGEAELAMGAGTLSLRIPEELRCELEFEVSDGEIELEIEFTWPTRARRRAAEPPVKSAEQGTDTGTPKPPARTKKTAARTAGSAKSAAPKRAAAASGGGRRTKRAAAKPAAA
ncbi:amphi-Trp domain-containing protein [Streptomyces sp. adm13(2018)]|uniref:amphi-Trp domain-containing protein n=1 Tax=Streptomyces sp. adm13(2018) TaxID=2479007 RepID=UPI0011CE9A3D|nr:amphi-Trp domain-containing protein [Streptomyces sp. adm13(2018)]TXS13770.1 amphi-Trp domain-containing protein [Streptomyces sp. adm13(2018)]